MVQLGYGNEGTPAYIPGVGEVEGIIAFASGMLIVAGGVHTGGIGVSGDSPENDGLFRSSSV